MLGHFPSVHRYGDRINWSNISFDTYRAPDK
jgi:hypothetical protein